MTDRRPTCDEDAAGPNGAVAAMPGFTRTNHLSWPKMILLLTYLLFGQHRYPLSL